MIREFLNTEAEGARFVTRVSQMSSVNNAGKLLQTIYSLELDYVRLLYSRVFHIDGFGCRST